MSLAEVLEKLNPSQREVVDCRDHCVAVAVPGAGKTATIAAKAALLLSNPALTVGAVTFSKDAAIELRDRILKLARVLRQKSGWSQAPFTHSHTSNWARMEAS